MKDAITDRLQVRLRGLLEYMRGPGILAESFQLELWERLESLPASPAGCLDLVEHGTGELVERTQHLLVGTLENGTLAGGRLIPDEPKGFRTAVLERAAESYPWDTSCDPGRALRLLLTITSELPENEAPSIMWPPEVATSEVAGWFRERAGIKDKPKKGARYIPPSRLFPKGTRKAAGSNLHVLPADSDGKPDSLSPSSFAVLYLAQKAVARWHAPHNDRHEGHTEVAAGVLSEVGNPDPEDRRKLADYLFDRERNLRKATGYPELSGERRAGARKDMLRADEMLASHLAGLGKEGHKRAGKIRKAARERWARGAKGRELYKLWREPGDAAPWHVQYLARAIWLDVLEPQLKAARRLGTPAVPREVGDKILAAFQRGGRKLESTEGGMVLLDGHRQVARVDTDRLAELRRKYPDRELDDLLRSHPATDKALLLLQRKLPAAMTLTAHKFIRWVVRKGFQQFVERKSDYRRIVVPQALLGLATMLKLPSKQDPGILRDTLDVYSAIQLDLDFVGGGHMWLLAWDLIKRPAPGRPAEIRITLNDPLLPQFAFEMLARSTSKRQYELARLVPVLSPEMLPPRIGRERDHAAQASLQDLTMREFAERSIEMVEQGGIWITDKRWLELGDESGLPSKSLSEVLDHWQRPGERGGQGWLFSFVEQIKPDVFKLGESFSREAEFLEKHGRDRIASEKGGKQSQAKKQRGRARVMKHGRKRKKKR